MSQDYRNYRGRRSKGKTALAVVLVLVIVVSLTFLFVQERILFFDETGTPYLWLSGQTEQAEPPAAEEIDLTIQPLEEQKEEISAPLIRGFRIPAPLTMEAWEMVPEGEWDAVAVTLKDGRGNVYFDSGTALSGTVQLAEGETESALAAVLDSDLHTIARIACFHDPKAANRETESMGLMNTGGYIFYDGNNSQWLDPAKEEARAYLCGIAVEAARMGFDEILLTEVSYPTEGKLDKIAYGETARAENIRLFLADIRLALRDYDVELSVELPEQVILLGADDAAGLDLRSVAALTEHVYAVTTPERMETLANRCDGFVAEVEAVPEGVEGSFLLT